MHVRSFISRLFNRTSQSSTESLPDTSSKTDARDNSSSGTLEEEVEEENDVSSPSEVMSALGVQVLDEGGDGFYLVGFQGGVFVFNFAKGCLTAMYNDIAECNYTDAAKATMVANDLNGEFSVWSCYLRTSNDDKTENPIKVCLSQLFTLNVPLEKNVEFIRSVLMNAFTVAREFRDRFKVALEHDSSMYGVLNNKDFSHKLNLAKRMMEVESWDQIHDEMPLDSKLSIHSLAALFDDSEFGQVCSLQVLVGDKVQCIVDEKEVENFSIRDYIRNLADNIDIQRFTFIAAFEIQDLVISLRKLPGSSQKSLFYAMNVMRTGVDADRFTRNHSVVSCRTTLEIRLTSSQEDYWEVKYMVDDAKEKISKDKVSELTNEQKMLLVEVQPSIQEDMYWGMKFYNKNCLFQSLYYFKRLYHNFSRIEQKTEQDMAHISEISLYIGMIYSQMRMNDRAFYYFDRARGLESIFSAECMINCMCSLKDSYVISYIQNMLEVVAKRLKGEEKLDQYYDFYLFLKRHMAEALFFERRLEDVSAYLQEMIENGEDVEFARKKLEDVKRLLNMTENKETKKDTQDNY